MKKLLSLGAFILALGLLTFVACKKEETVNAQQQKEELSVQALTSADGYVYDYDKYGTMVYNQAKYFNGTFEPSNYLPTDAALKFKNEFPAFLSQQNLLYPTLESKLNAYTAHGTYTVNSKNLILNYVQELNAYLQSSNALTLQDITDFILTKENTIIHRTDLTDAEKMAILPLSSIVRNFMKLKYETYIAHSQMTAQARGDCPWWRVAECLQALWDTGVAASEYATVGAGLGSVIPGVGNVVGGAIGAAVGIAVNFGTLKGCRDDCLAANAVPPYIPPNPCGGANDLAIKIVGCGLTQQFVATGQGKDVNVFQGPVNGATTSNVISTTPTFSLTQSNPNVPVTISLLSGCGGQTLSSLPAPKTFNIAELVGDPGFVDILGPTEVCLKGEECYDLGGSFLCNSNNTTSFNIPASSDYTVTYNPNGGFCMKWRKAGSYTFSTTVTNACSGLSKTTSITINVVDRTPCE
jgi:hypothetical protein